MTSFTIIENAVKMGLITYKELVEQLCVSNAELADELFKQVSPAEDDPKVLRKIHKAAQVAKLGKNKDAIKEAMNAYDKSVKPPSEPKPKRAPPVRVWTEQDKAYTKEKNAFVKAKMKALGDEITLADQKLKKKGFIAEFARLKAEAEDEAEDEDVAEDEAEGEGAVEGAVEDEDEDAEEPNISFEVPTAATEEPKVPAAAAEEPKVPAAAGLTENEQKEWSALKKKDKAGTLDLEEKARYKELKKKK